ncbi:MAG: 50S ribosome-binding GTPase [Phycisphaeraceae bacterium]|nr:50S ribosome-binding GTPase [Phycisphaeraceae bacterium]
MPVRAYLQSPRGLPGAIALFRIAADSERELDACLEQMGSRPVRAGQARLSTLHQGHQAVIARWTPTEAHVMPHGGIIVLKQVESIIKHAGADLLEHQPLLPDKDDPAPHLESALANAASPLAIDLLLDQPRRWSLSPRVDLTPAHASMLRHLLEPALVVAWGPPNVGKSTLLNALATRTLAITSPEPGTTRDHVGAMLDMGGLLIRYLDTPGVRDDPHPAEAQAIDIARSLAQTADLILWCRDASSPPPPLPRTSGIVLPVDLRSDLGTPQGPEGIRVSAFDPHSIRSLAAAIRQTLVPDAALADPGAWAFWRTTPRTHADRALPPYPSHSTHRSPPSTRGT